MRESVDYPSPSPPHPHPPMPIPYRTLPIPNLNLRWFGYWFLVSLDDNLPIKCIASHTTDTRPRPYSGQNPANAAGRNAPTIASSEKNEIDQSVQIH